LYFLYSEVTETICRVPSTLLTHMLSFIQLAHMCECKYDCFLLNFPVQAKLLAAFYTSLSTPYAFKLVRKSSCQSIIVKHLEIVLHFVRLSLQKNPRA